MAKSPTEQIRELVVELRVLAERDENRRRDLERVTETIDTIRTELAASRQEIAVAHQQLQDHVKHTEERDCQRWALFLVLVAAVFSLASGLIVTLARR